MIQFHNRPFYSCLLSDLVFEWHWGWRWPCFKWTSLILLCKSSCSNPTSLHLHEKSREVCIKTRPACIHRSANRAHSWKRPIQGFKSEKIICHALELQTNAVFDSHFVIQTTFPLEKTNCKLCLFTTIDFLSYDFSLQFGSSSEAA